MSTSTPTAVAVNPQFQQLFDAYAGGNGSIGQHVGGAVMKSIGNVPLAAISGSDIALFLGGEPEMIAILPTRARRPRLHRWLDRREPPPQGTGRYPYLRPREDSGYDSVPYLQSPFNVEDAQFSPDGRYVAYLLDEEGPRLVRRGPRPRTELSHPERTTYLAAVVLAINAAVQSARLTVGNWPIGAKEHEHEI